jgi:pyruvate formate lyase activating enzyme
MSWGTVFDIREFSLHDGPGLRTTVFLKGCPLRCTWCHNPEGQMAEPQTIEAAGLRRVVGRRYEDRDLASLLNRQAPVLRDAGGGVTFSGGEPLAQAEFLGHVIDRLDGVHIVLDTSGYAAPEAFRRVVARCHLVHYDLKLIDPEMHRRYTGCDNRLILDNLRRLSESGIPFVARIPLVPGVTDREENLAAVARVLRGVPGLLHVDLLPYNRAAGGKYAPFGMTFHPHYDEQAAVHIHTRPFEDAGIEVRVGGSSGGRGDSGNEDKRC